MIRFLNLANQISEGINSFAFYDTVTDAIIEFGGENKFDDVEGFTKACLIDNENKHLIERCLKLIPDDFHSLSSHSKKAQELIKKFYEIMPFNDTKLTCSDENPELIIKMEYLSAQQAAQILVDEILANNQGKEYWNAVLKILNRIE